MKSKIVLYIFAIIAFALLLWYLLFKGYNYRIAFKTSLPPGAVYSSLTEWKNLNTKTSDSIIITNKNPINSLEFTLYDNDSVFNYDWDLNREEDNTTEVVIYVRDNKNSFLQNVIVPFKRNDFIKRSVSETKLFLTYLSSLEKGYSLSVNRDSIETVPSKFIAYISLNSAVTDKANEMAAYIGYIMGYIRKYDIELDGDPFLKVTNLDLENNMIEYNFCFPIIEQDSFPPAENIYFEKFPEFNGIHATFNGNYRATQFAWLELLDYAERNNIEVLNEPLEIYRNDPQSGTNSDEWVADVYLPIIEN